MLGIIGWIILGIVAGAIARLLMPGRDSMGWLATMALGIAGAFVGGFLGRMLFGRGGDANGFEPAGLIGAVIGAMILLALLRMFSRQPRLR